MGKNAADTLFPQIRRSVLAALLLHPKRRWYLSELARHLNAAPSHLHRELNALSRAGILTRTVEGRQTYFEANRHCPYLSELTGLVRKLMGVPVVVARALEPFRSRIRVAFIHGSIARGSEEPESDAKLKSAALEILRVTEPGDVLIVKHSHEPHMLYTLWDEAGHERYTEQVAPGEWWIFVRKHGGRDQ